MKFLKKTLVIILCIIVGIFYGNSYAQITTSDSVTWDSFKSSAHQIGFCLYHIEQDVCTEHNQIEKELIKIHADTLDTYYFTLNENWAKERLTELASRNNTNSEDYLILFDIDQGAFRELYDSTTMSNTYRMFSILDINNNYTFTVRNRISKVLLIIQSDKENSIVSNGMWREFMSNRPGRLDKDISITINGKDAINSGNDFKTAFLSFLEDKK